MIYLLYKMNDITRAGGDIQKTLSSPFVRKYFSTTPFGELHWYNATEGRTDNFTGPGTRLDLRLNPDDTPREWSEPVDAIDAISMRHDIAYKHAGDDLSKKHEADRIMVMELNNLTNLDFKTRVKRNIIKYMIMAKEKLGLGIGEVYPLIH